MIESKNMFSVKYSCFELVSGLKCQPDPTQRNTNLQNNVTNSNPRRDTNSGESQGNNVSPTSLV